MANALYTAYKQLILGAGLNLSSGDVKLVITDHGTDTPNVATDDFLNDISAGTVGSASGNFTTKTITGGVFDADDVVLTAVSGASCESINVFHDSGSAATSELIVYFDTGTNIPFTPNGGDITISWDSGTNKVFKL